MSTRASFIKCPLYVIAPATRAAKAKQNKTKHRIPVLSPCHCYDKIYGQKQLKGDRAYFGSQFQEDKIRHGGEDTAAGKGGMLAGAGGWYPHC